MKHSPRTAFTLVELLVVIAIIGLLVSLLLPAVSIVRESARRVSCAEHVSQLIIGVHHFEMAFNEYPPGTLDAKGPIVNAKIGYHHNWIIQILPYLEERNTWQAIDKSVSVYHAKNAAPAALPLAVLNCPSSLIRNSAVSHYAGVHNDTEKPIDAKDNGIFFLNSHVRYDDVTDGVSHTAFIGEKLPDRWDFFWMSGTRATLRNAGSGTSGPIIGILGTQGDEAEVADELAAENAAAGGGVGPGNPLWVGGFGSQHGGRAHFALGDGSVHLMSALLPQLGNRSDGQLSQGF